MKQVASPCPIIIPITYYQTPSAWRDRMHAYKESPEEKVRDEQSQIVGGVLTRYISEHGAALIRVFGHWDYVVAVPSTKHPPGSALSRSLAANFSNLIALDEFLLPGIGKMDRNQAAEDGFVVTSNLDGSYVLVVDDTFTTGARLHSASHALHSVGAHVVAGVVIARKINPDPRYFTANLWSRQSSIPFSFTDSPWWDQ